MQRQFIVLLLSAIWCTYTHAQVWQWSIPVKGARNAASRAFLWVPEDCRKIKAVVLAQHNMEEQSIVEHSVFRDEMSRLSFAIIWVSPSFDHFFRFDEGAGEVFNGMMNDLAAESGYTELAYAPVVGIGHSAAASWPYYFAAWNPERTLACISVSGQWPYFRHPTFAPDIWGKRNIDFIPCLETMGEYEAAATWSAEGLKQRQQHVLMPLSMLACPAEGHFAATTQKIQYIALYIRKAAQYRLPKQYPAQGPPELVPVDPMQAGWLKDKWRLDERPMAPSAASGNYAGDVTQAFWFFDKEMVKATEQYESVYRNRKAQLLGYVQDGKVVPQKNTHQQVDLLFQPQEDGITFAFTATFLDTVPGAHPRTSEWTGLRAGSPIGRARPDTIIIDCISGPCKKIGDTTFQISLEKGMNNNNDVLQCWFTATHPGDKEYKPAVQQAKMNIPAINKEGMEQTITFPVIKDVKQGTKTIMLQATSDAQAPVKYYVREGPAIITGRMVTFTRIPPRSKFPVKVTIVAWQYGRSVEPKLKTAQPVEQSFYIVK